MPASGRPSSLRASRLRSRPQPAADDTSDDPAATKFELETARLLLEQVRYLVDDERSFGEKLVADRKIKLSVLAIIAGLGLLRPSFVVVLLELLTSGTPFGWFACVVTALTAWALPSALVLILAESPLFKKRNRSPIDEGAATTPDDATDEPTSDEALDDAEQEEPTDDGPDARTTDDANEPATEDDPRDMYSAALVVLYADPREPYTWPASCHAVRRRVEQHRAAYLRMAEKNRLVRQRLERGTAALISGFVGVIILLVLGGVTELDDGEVSGAAPPTPTASVATEPRTSQP